MKPIVITTKTVLIASIAANVILLGAIAYLDSMPVMPQSTPAIIYYINKGDHEAVETAIKAVGLTTPAP